MDSQRDVIAKIQKLLALGKSDNEHESAAAMARAHALMDKYRIEAAMLEDVKVHVVQEETKGWEDPILFNPGGILPRWQQTLVMHLVRHNGCYLYRTWKPSKNKRGQAVAYMVIGKATSVQTARYFVSYCTQEINRLIRTVCAGEGATYRQQFAMGCVDAVAIALEIEREALIGRMRKEYASNERALVVVNNAVANIEAERGEARSWGHRHLGLRSGSGIGAGKSDPCARERGRAAGARVYPGASGARGLGSGPRQLS